MFQLSPLQLGSFDRSFMASPRVSAHLSCDGLSTTDIFRENLTAAEGVRFLRSSGIPNRRPRIYLLARQSEEPKVQALEEDSEPSS